MPDFSEFDSRGYPVLDAREGYGRWAASYDETVLEELDLALLERLDLPAWREKRRAADLGCGTGRTAAWLRERGVAAIDGVDLSPEMLARARDRGAHDRLVEADVAATGLEPGAYDLVISSLVDEHLRELGPLYEEAERLAGDGAHLVLACVHPQFLIATGIPTHFHDESGEPHTIETHVHLVTDHVDAAAAAGWSLAELREGLVDDRVIEVKPGWERYRDDPVSLALVWERD
jgi:SAM-dependent methyltransferase